MRTRIVGRQVGTVHAVHGRKQRVLAAGGRPSLANAAHRQRHAVGRLVARDAGAAVRADRLEERMPLRVERTGRVQHAELPLLVVVGRELRQRRPLPRTPPRRRRPGRRCHEDGREPHGEKRRLPSGHQAPIVMRSTIGRPLKDRSNLARSRPGSICRRQRSVGLDRAAKLEELGVGGPAAERLRVADLSFDGRDDVRERQWFCKHEIHLQSLLDARAPVLEIDDSPVLQRLLPFLGRRGSPVMFPPPSKYANSPLPAICRVLSAMTRSRPPASSAATSPVEQRSTNESDRPSLRRTCRRLLFSQRCRQADGGNGREPKHDKSNGFHPDLAA